jgi:hypothetical protein
MTMKVLYLQKYYSKNSNPLRGRRLYEQLQRDSEECRLSYIVRPNKDAVEPQFSSDVITYEELNQFNPDLIFVEGGLIEENEWRVPEEVIERLVTKGTVILISDVGWNMLNQQKEQYERALSLCRVSVAYDGREPVELYDSKNYYESERQIICNPNDIAYEEWLAPVYEALPPFVVGGPVPMRGWVELVATCNRSTTRATRYVSGMVAGIPESGAFASACRIDLGYLVLITGEVSSDVWMDAFPGNLEWLTRLVSHLVERVRIDRRRNVMSYQVFISHRHQHQDFARSFRDELRRRGFGTWLDSRKLIAGDELTPEIQRAIDGSSHFALLWSASCVNAEWIWLETRHALKANKRIFIIRLDETPVPTELADRLRIEALGLQASEAAKLVTLFIEREESRSRSFK